MGNEKWEMRNGKQGNGEMGQHCTSGESVYKRGQWSIYTYCAK